MDSNKDISMVLFKHWKFIVFGAAVAVIAGVIVTLLMPKKYLSYAEVYPNMSNSMDEVVSAPQFGFDIHADRLIQVLESQVVMDSVIEKFDLASYYELDTGKTGWEFDLYKNYTRDIKFERNPKLAIVITAKTKDPLLSANIVNYILEIVDPIRSKILKANTLKAIEHYQMKYNDQLMLTNELMNRVYHINVDSTQFDPLQDERLNKMMGNIELLNTNPLHSTLLRLSMSTLSMEDEKLINEYLYEFNQLNHFKQKLRATKDAAEVPIPEINVLSRGKAVHKAVSPSLISNILVSLFIGLIGSIFIILIREKYSMIKLAKRG